ALWTLAATPEQFIVGAPPLVHPYSDRTRMSAIPDRADRGTAAGRPPNPRFRRDGDRALPAKTPGEVSVRTHDVNLAAVELAGITKRFGPLVAVDQVSLSIERGEVFAIVGENGAGKSTLMNVLFGIHRPDAGEVLLDGAPAAI